MLNALKSRRLWTGAAVIAVLGFLLAVGVNQGVRAFVVLPEDAPRAALAAAPGPDEPISYPHMEYAWANGYSKKYASAGWASYERHFVHWAERAGFELDIVSQFDLQLNPEHIQDYSCISQLWSLGVLDDKKFAMLMFGNS